MSSNIKLQFKILAVFLGVLLIFANVFFVLEIGKIKRQLNANTNNVGQIVQFINQAIQNAQEKTN